MQLRAETGFAGSGILMEERATPLEAERNPKVREEAISSPKPASRSLPPQRYRPRPVVQSRPGSQTPKSLDV